MVNVNPYQAPAVEIVSRPFPEAAGEGVWRDGKLLVMWKEAELPDRCVKCNAPSEGFRLKRRLSWHPPVYYVLVLFWIILYFVVAIIVSHKANIKIGLCPRHRRKRRRAILIGWLLSLGGFFAMVVGIANDAAGIALLGLVSLLAGIFYGIIASQPVTAKRIDKDLVYLKGVHPDYLAQLPAVESR